MADTRATASVHDLRPEDVALRHQEENLPGRLFLELGPLVYVALGQPDADLAAEAAAMRELARLAGEAAAELERRAAPDPR